ncbi:MAG: type II secretion system F family protein [Candidatus Micrarchaeota archaeon]|nr:type II secretion system F family protein [Candidatus Micrarchaeota archaeon]
MAADKIRIPILLLPLSSLPTVGARLKGIGVKILAFYPSLRYDLRSIGIEAPPEYYCGLAFVSTFIWSLLITLFVGIISSLNQTMLLPVRILTIFLSFSISFLFFMVLHLAFPRIIAKSIAAKIDHELIFAMRDMLIQVNSGIPLFNAIENIGNSNYKYVGPAFREVATNVKGGSSLLEELENMAIRTQSVYLKKVSWQLVTAIRAGANLSSTLRSIVKLLVDYQFSLFKSFNAELNFIILIYLMVAAVLPTIGTTVLVIFSVFGMLGITPEVLGGVVALGFIGQLGIIAYVKVKRPSLFSD